MRQGFLPSQRRELRRAFKKAQAFDRFRQRTRRGFLGMLGFAAVAGAGGVWAGRATSPRAPSEPNALQPEDLVHLHDLAFGPIENLERRAMHVVDGIRRHPGDERLGYGIQRLITVALVHPTNLVLRARLHDLATDAKVFPRPVEEALEQFTAFTKR